MFNNRKLEDRIKKLENTSDYEVVYLRRDLSTLQDLVYALVDYLEVETGPCPKVRMVKSRG